MNYSGKSEVGKMPRENGTGPRGHGPGTGKGTGRGGSGQGRRGGFAAGPGGYCFIVILSLHILGRKYQMHKTVIKNM
jgi:hypothetical protein